ncbi:unnamed protein product [Rotaria sp. Silwood2]|nr:unnamed protein product [Rotaria sp. Silwood2]
MIPFNIVLFTGSDLFDHTTSTSSVHHSQLLWRNIETTIQRINYRCETVQLDQLDFSEQENINKVLNADLVIMDVTNQEHRPTFMYYKSNRDNFYDIVLIETNAVDNEKAIEDFRDYESMIELSEQFKEINNTEFTYLIAFALERRNQNDDLDKALNILEKLCTTNQMDSELMTDISCLYGRIYKDKFKQGNYLNQEFLHNAIIWYRRGFEGNPNLYAGINLLILLYITIDDLKNDPETYNIIIQLNILLGKKIRWLEGSTDYWDVATYFELHAVQQEWKKACQAALQMYLLNPSSWRFTTTLNNLKIVHDARLTLNKQKSCKKLSNKTTSEDDIYNFWIDFFNDAINSDLKSLENKELPAQLPILIRDNYERVDATGFMNMYVEGRLQLNFHTGTDPQTLVIRLLEQHKHIHDYDRVKTIEMNLIKSIV